MRKLTTLLAMTLVLAGLCFLVPAANASSSASGSMRNSSTIYVEVLSDYGFIELTSNKGVASVNAHFASVFSNGSKEEEHHGFYLVSGYGFGGSFRWVPSATRSLLDAVGMTRQVGDSTVKLEFNGPGTYEITISPFSNSKVNEYWRVDTINAWVKYPTWQVTYQKNCSVTVR